MDSAVITGLGLVTPLGADVDSNWSALMQGRSISDHSRVPGFAGTRRINDLAISAANQALSHADWQHASDDSETMLIVGTSKGAAVDWISETDQPDHVDRVSHPSAFGLADVAASLADALGLAGGPRLTLAGACASGLHALARATIALAGGEARRVLVVAAEASVHPLFIGSFERLGVIAPEGYGCRPFDLHRGGFVVSEAAAAVCLEPAEASHRAVPVARLEQIALAGDASHLTAGDPDGKTLRRLLARVIDARPIDLIHAHGTATLFNDPLELSAIDAALEARRGQILQAPPSLFSHKAALGHSLGAAGMVAVVLNCVSHLRGELPGNVRTSDALTCRHVKICRFPAQRQVSRSVAIASGFGGSIAIASLTGSRAS